MSALNQPCSLLLFPSIFCPSKWHSFDRQCYKQYCSGFAWDRVSFLRSSYQGVLITAEQRLHRVKAFSASPTTPPMSRLGVHEKVGGGTAGTVDPSYPRDIPCHATSCSACKARGRRRKGKMFRAMAFIFPNVCHMWWSPAFLEMAEQLPADGKQGMNSLFCFACRCSFWFTYQTVFNSTHGFSHLHLLVLSPIPLVRRETAAVWCLVAGWG